MKVIERVAMEIMVMSATKRLLSLVGMVGISACLTLPVLAQSDTNPKLLAPPAESESLAPKRDSEELILESVPTPEFPTSTNSNNALGFRNNVERSTSEFMYFPEYDKDQYLREWIFR